MRVDVHFTRAEVDSAALAEATAVVINVLRATTTIVEALANGAVGVYPTVSAEDAVKLAASLGREDTLLCGERKGVKVDGFDLGNSPAEFTAEVVDGKKLVMSTTNGTRAFSSASEAPTRARVCFHQPRRRRCRGGDRRNAGGAVRGAGGPILDRRCVGAPGT